MNPTVLFYMFVVSSIVTAFCLVLTSLARNKARDERYKRKIIEYEYKHCKSLFSSKEKLLQCRLESKEYELKALSSEIKNLQLETDKDCKLLNVNTKYLIESKDNKIEAQNAKITLLQADCNRLQKELHISKNK